MITTMPYIIGLSRIIIKYIIKYIVTVVVIRVCDTK